MSKPSKPSNPSNPLLDQKTDYLKQDPHIPGQTYTVVSFVNPKDMVLEKSLYYANEFMVHDINSLILAQAMQMVKKLNSDMTGRISGVLDKLKLSVDEEDKHIYRILNDAYRPMQIDEDQFVTECKREYMLDRQEILDKYTAFLSQNRSKMDQVFDKSHGDATSVRGFKVRGCFSRIEDARQRAKFLRDNVEQAIHAFVVETGTWFPVDMDADEVQDQDYMLPKLNELMGKYNEGIQARDQLYHERKQEMAQTGSSAHSAESVKERLRRKLEEKRELEESRELEKK